MAESSVTKAWSGALTFLQQNSHSAIDQHALLHGESLLIISSCDSQCVTLQIVSQNASLDVGAHSPVIEVTTAWQKYNLR